MALIADPTTGTAARVETTPGALRVMLYGPDGTPLVSQMRGGPKNLRTDGGTEERDGVALLLPGSAGSLIGGTAAAPLRTDPTGTTTQPVSGTLGANLRVGGGDVTPANPVPVAFPARQAVQVDFPPTQQVAFGSAQPVTFPSAQPVNGTVNANLRVANGDVGAGNRVPVDATGSVTVTAASALPIVVTDPTDVAAEFTATIDVAGAAVVADGGVLWALRNGGAKTIGIRRADLQQGFTGTAAATRTSYEFRRFVGTPSGGTAIAPAKKVASSAASTASVLQGTAALTVTGVTFDAGAVHRVSSANQLTATSAQDVVFQGGPLLLAPGEGLAIRASGATVVGSFLVGSLGWYEL